MSFDHLGLGPETLKAVRDAGYEHPTPIQEKAIPVVLQGRDVFGCAQTGTGKTASFVLPMIDILSSGRARARMPRSLILTPTRELAIQIAENFRIYGKYHKLTMALLIGGVSVTDQQRALDRGVDVLIATPGRLLDLFDRGSVLLTGVKAVVIDEADRMLDMGFIPDVDRIIGLLSPIRQTMMFSATLLPEVRRLADRFLSSPKEIAVAPPASPPDMVEQSLATVPERDKLAALCSLIRSQPVENALIFCNRKRDVDELDRSLRRHGFSCTALHGDMPQSARMQTMKDFKDGKVILLVATDVAGRGLDIEGLSHVFNFDVPLHAEDYVHRIGRTGRAGRRGRAFTLATPADAKYLKAITELIRCGIPRFTIADFGHAEPVAEARGPRRQRGKTDERRGEAAVEAAGHNGRRKKAAAAKTRKTREAVVGRDRGSAAGRERPATGMGDHVPAFMLRPFRAAG
jgi:superfamily II DNA/RNA helicase